MEKDTGSILKLHPLGENSLIVCWCTERHGIIRTAARGARKAGSDFSGRLDLFHECELLFAPARRGDLHALGSVSLLSPRLGLRQQLLRLRLASYMAQLILCTVEAGGAEASEENAVWHTLVAAALDYIAKPQTQLRPAILLRFEQRLARLHGLHSPALPPQQALLQHFRQLPAGRAELLEALLKNGDLSSQA